MVLFPGKGVDSLSSIFLLICRDLIVQLISKKTFDVRQGVNLNWWGGGQAGKYKKDASVC